MKQFETFAGTGHVELVTYLIDTSLSMDENMGNQTRLEVSCKAGRTLVKLKAEQYPDDRVAIVTFCRSARIVHRLTLPEKLLELRSCLRNYKTGECTNIKAGLKKAFRTLRFHSDSQRRIILLSDGCSTCGGDPVDFATKIKSAHGITIDVIGIASSPKDVEFNERVLRNIASGPEHYCFIHDAGELITKVRDLGHHLIPLRS